MVELLGSYSNNQTHTEKLRSLLSLSPVSDPRPAPGDPRQLQHRLTEAERDELIADFKAGATAVALAKRFAVHRHTVLALLDDRGLSRRYKLIGPGQIEEVHRRYEDGASLKRVGEELGVDASTVRRALLKWSFASKRGLMG